MKVSIVDFNVAKTRIEHSFHARPPLTNMALQSLHPLSSFQLGFLKLSVGILRRRIIRGYIWHTTLLLLGSVRSCTLCESDSSSSKALNFALHDLAGANIARFDSYPTPTLNQITTCTRRRQ